MNFINNMFRAKPGPNRSSRPLNMPLLLEIPIRLQWKTSRAPNKKSKQLKNPLFEAPCWDYFIPRKDLNGIDLSSAFGPPVV